MSPVRRRLLALLISLTMVAGALVMYSLRPSPRGATSTTAGLAGHQTHPVSTATTVPAGALPQTRAFPSASSPAFLEKMRQLVHAAALDRPTLAMSAFFPLAAYIQVKAITDPVTDWHERLIANYESDIGLMHEQLGPDSRQARFASVDVPSESAVWVLPGVEYNKGSYWRVYDTTVYYRENGTVGHFPITSLISWRGEWYIVHLGEIR